MRNLRRKSSGEETCEGCMYGRCFCQTQGEGELRHDTAVQQRSEGVGWLRAVAVRVPLCLHACATLTQAAFGSSAFGSSAHLNMLFICVGTSLQVGTKLDGVWRVGPCLAVLMLPSHGAAEGGTFSSGHRRLEAHSRADGGAAGRMRGPRSLRGATRHKAVWALARRVCLDG